MKRQKTGGRQKGTPNKSTAELKDILTNFVSQKIDEISADYDELSAHDRLLFITKILPYIVPKAAEKIEITEFKEQPLFGDDDDED